MSGAANNDPEPIEDRIANAIKKGLEPFVLRLEAAAVSLQVARFIGRSNLHSGLDDLHGGLDDENVAIEKAVSIALRVLSASYDGLEFNRKTRAAWKREVKEVASDSWLLCESQAGDDSFRQYLRQAGAPEFILKRGFRAHHNALLKHNLLINDGTMKDGEAVFSLRLAYANKYIQVERAAKAKAAKRRRNKDA